MSSTQFLNVGEGKIAFDVSGDEGAPTVLFVHGMGDNRKTYRHIHPFFSRAGFRTVTMDMRGHGESDASFLVYDDVAVANDIQKLIFHLNSEVVIFANSMSCACAIIVKEAIPTKIIGLVLSGPFVRGGLSEANCMMRSLVALLMCRPFGRSFWRSLYKGFFFTMPKDQNEIFEELDKVYDQKAHFEALQKVVWTSHKPSEEMLTSTMENNVKGKGRCIVVMGKQDQDWPKPLEEAEWVKQATGAELVVALQKSGHYPHLEEAEECWMAIRELVRNWFVR